MKDLEILAPAGGMPQLIAAVRSGADAVYVGLKKFSARASAMNFDGEELKEAVKYCHTYGVKLHVTLNTLVYENEYGELFDSLKQICEAGADAVIVQDLAVAKYIRKACPEIELHASTQMAIHNAEGACEAYRLGFSRVVLARELTYEEIKNIRKNTPSELELEAFVHGALCMSVSGRCELSAMLGGRSGNRGACAQPCRLDFSCGKMHSCLSLKDMSYISQIDKLYGAGVCSVKIEGRMKRPEYVAAAVNACVRAKNGETPDTELLKNIFSRSGFTDGYLTGSRTRDMFGVRTKEDVEASKGALSKTSELYRRERQRVFVDFELFIGGKETKLTVSDEINTTFALAEGGVVTEGLNPPTDEAFASSFLSRLGGTPYLMDSVKVINEGGLSIRASVINSLRRDAVEKLNALRADSVKYTFSAPQIEKYAKKSIGKTAIYVKSLAWEKISSFADKSDKIVLPISEILSNKAQITEKLGDFSKVVGEIPSLVYNFTALDEKIEEIRALGIKILFCDNIGAVAYAREKNFEIIGGFGLNIVNSDALDKYREMGVSEATLSPEIPLSAVKELSGSTKTGLFAYGYLPLMLLRSCPVRAAIGCEKCRGKGEITDRLGIKFSVVCHNKIYSELLNSVPHYIGDRRLPVDFALLSFTKESREECEKIFKAFTRGEKIAKRTTGLYT
ncbi:MAG: U32 family peptidase [Clostridia bacterium]|nr:U32 family peptidase [Clostridia bacterium]